MQGWQDWKPAKGESKGDLTPFDFFDEMYPRKTIIVNIQFLVDALKKSFTIFVNELDSQPEKMMMVYERAQYYFANRPARRP